MRSVLEAAIALQLLVSWYAVCAVHLPTSCTRRTKSLFELDELLTFRQIISRPIGLCWFELV